MLRWQKMLEPGYVPPKRKGSLLKERRGVKRKKGGSKRKGAPQTQKVGANRKDGGQSQRWGINAKDGGKSQRRLERERYGQNTERGYIYVPVPPPEMNDAQSKMDFEWELSSFDGEKSYAMYDRDTFCAVLKDRGYSPKWGDVMLSKVLGLSPRTVCNRRSDGNWSYWQIVLIADVLEMTPLEFLNCFFSGCFQQDEKGNTYVKCNSEDVKRLRAYQRGQSKLHVRSKV